MERIKVGIMGCGNISDIYFSNCKNYATLEVAACADLDLERAKEKAEKHGIAKACTVDELLADPEIQMIINLTIPQAHAEISLKALEQGKHVYVEKPLAVTREDGLRVLQKAKEKGLLLGSAPETSMGGGIQTCRKLIDDGAIGRPLAASAFMMSRGHEHWHPNPAFFYLQGGGPMLDMGPYYLTALIHLLGPIRRVSGSATIAFPERTITSKPLYGNKIKVEVPTHVTGVLEFAQGTVATVIMSFDIQGGTELPSIEIYGSEGTLRVPDPNTFGGPVWLRKKGDTEWTEVELTHGLTQNNRGIGVAEMAYALQHHTDYRVNGDVAYHVLEAMYAFYDASEQGRYYEMSSSCKRPDAMPVDGLPI